jgi:flagellar hook-associated protein 2
VGDFESLEAVGISLDENGQMTLDKTKLTAAYNENHAALKQFFTEEDFGVAAKLDEMIERLSGEEGSLLTTRAETLADTIKTNSERVTAMDERLARQRERLLLQFIQLETMVAELQTGLNALSAFTPIPPLTSTQGN